MAWVRAANAVSHPRVVEKGPVMAVLSARERQGDKSLALKQIAP